MMKVFNGRGTAGLNAECNGQSPGVCISEHERLSLLQSRLEIGLNRRGRVGSLAEVDIA